MLHQQTTTTTQNQNQNQTQWRRRTLCHYVRIRIV
jgi:hypothetical protein